MSPLPTATPTIRILLVDDHPSVRYNLKQLLQTRRDFDVVGEAASGEEAITLTDQLRPDIVVMDMSMPGMNGVEATKAIKAQHPEVQVVGLTAFGEMPLIIGMVKAGAAGYLMKGGKSQELVESLRAVAQGQGALDRGVTRKVMNEMAERYKQEAEALAELDRMKSEFVSVVSHELRTPLTSIKGGAHTLKRGWATIEEGTREDLLDSIITQSDRLARMVEKILLVSGIQRGRIGLNPSSFALDKLAREALSLVQEKTQGRTVILELEKVQASGDPERLREAVASVIENALDFTSGTVTITVSRERDAELTVEDEGPGIDPETLEQLLNKPFVQADSSDTRRVGGLGLSLYIVRQIALASGGEFPIETGTERGTVAKLILPLASRSED